MELPRGLSAPPPEVDFVTAPEEGLRRYGRRDQRLEAAGNLAGGEERAAGVPLRSGPCAEGDSEKLSRSVEARRVTRARSAGGRQGHPRIGSRAADGVPGARGAFYHNQ